MAAHQVLARKWRPRSFETLVGQEHVVRALTHALSSGRLHHAYLFTGTRGVGKTTIARILAKALNCETGITATPCGQCRACTEIDAGRFVDYVEMDAASNRRVEEMTQLLENAVYAPSAARFKVYVIDEVHMLSAHAFNAMLKTLEEPPPHVVFVLATTDPQKVPVTVLSRCLQFNLKNMPADKVAGHLARVLEAEGVAFEAGALPHLGRAAAGSMRDALSLLDQAIAFGGGALSESNVREMLGVVDRRWLGRILESLLAGDGAALAALADEMSLNNAPLDRTLQDLAALLQRIALAQVGVLPDDEERGELEDWAARIGSEDVQVYYQIALHGARDLALAVDAHSGFTMTLLRLLAFRPQSDEPPPRTASPTRPSVSVAGGAAGTSAKASAGSPPASSTASAPVTGPSAAAALAQARAATGRPPARPAVDSRAPAMAPTASPTAPTMTPPMVPVAAPAIIALDGQLDGKWPELAEVLPLKGISRQFMQQSELVGIDGSTLRVRVPIRPLAEAGIVAKVREALSAHLGQPIRLEVSLGEVTGPTAASVATQLSAERHSRAEQALQEDPFVRTLLSEFGGRILPESIRPGPDE